jgi:hypothetical protein
MADQRFQPSGELDAVLMDLDNTLCSTDHLHFIRMGGSIAQLTPHLPRLCVYAGLDRAMAELAAAMKVGIVSRSPRWYMEAVLEQLFPDITWAALVSYDDVKEQKPHPEGLLLAAEQLGIRDRSRIVYLGDSKGDIEAAYHAGMRPVLCTWEPSPTEAAKAAKIVPDAVLHRPEDMLSYVADPAAFLPVLEARLVGRPAPAGILRQVSEFGGRGGPFPIYVLGRYFADAGLTLHLHGNHPLSKWMDRKDQPGEFEHPRLISAVADAVASIVQERGITALAVIPAKQNSVPRMELLFKAVVDRLRADGLSNLKFDPDLLAFLPDAQKIKRLPRADRQAEVERSLLRNGGCAGESVLIADDVLTSGGTLLTGRRLLIEGGAKYVAGLAMAKTVSGAAFDADPTHRDCPKCGRRLRLLRSAYGPFWGCEGYRIDGCDFKVNA